MTATLRSVQFASSHNSNKVRCEPGWMWKRSTPLVDYDLWYVAEGSGQIQLSGHTYPLKPGTCMLVRPHSLPLATHDPTDRLLVVFIHFTIQAPSPESLDLPSEYSLIHDIFTFENMLHHLLEVDVNRKPWKEEEFDFLMKLIFIHLYNLQDDQHNKQVALTAKQMKKIRCVVDFIQSENVNKIEFDDIYKNAQLSPRYLNLLFKQFMGISLKEYITRSRLRRAQNLLMESSFSITEISEALGYSDVYTFSRLFKKYTGVSPTQYHHMNMKITPNG